MSQTPNVPRIKGSFFHRKFRDFSNCPPTPLTPRIISKYNNQNSGGSSGGGTKLTPIGRRLANKRFRSSSGGSNGNNYNNESITSDYSTPKTTRTPGSTSTSCSKLRSGKRVIHLVYRPLELDTESSSESMELNFKRRNSNNKRLAIEQAPESAVTSPILDSPTINDDNNNNDHDNVNNINQDLSDLSDDSPSTPLAIEQAPQAVMTTFIPGNIWIFNNKKLSQEQKSAAFLTNSEIKNSVFKNEEQKLMVQ